MENSDILRKTSKNEIINAIDQNSIDFWKTFSNFLDKDESLKKNPKFEISVKKEVSKIFTGMNHPIGNAFTRANFTEQQVYEKVSIYLNLAKQKNIPFIWWVGALSKPHNLGEILAKIGLIKDESPGMYLNLRDIDETKYKAALNRSKIKIEQILNPKEEKFWLDLCSTIFEMEEVKDEIDRMWRVCLKFCDAYLATYEGNPVGISMVFYGGGVAGIYNVGVHPDYRNRGIGTAITLAPTIQAKKKGYEISILMSSEIGFKVYSQIGFQECCKFNQYIYIPQPNEEK
ncbi:GNAT family N-acetyltransferase [Promethearchaeum syntrophicum]|uniref:GNAT family N-acetyltransferase n=1 Tax=Promethearchaeum syntrophicum TaxID=2594042 RepID=A0A5B9D7R8_9ARCH|nr:GNAT family N-acetyltransferase [Candidatus Prometheoarchaeum syntrophicum]QEE15071.1 hypothetical protein DSAG12_00894 [Candidatus Prometheoarchaeum syntrophicum]